LDRFLISAEASDIEPLILANKADLASERDIEEGFGPFRALGYRVIVTSARQDRGLDEVRERLKNTVSAFVGPSGAGKSSLLNALQPGLNLKTGDIGYVTFKGRHTTTASQLIPFRFGGWVADTPGLRELELMEHQRDELEHCFPEFEEHLGSCRFQDCRHESEPGCAIKAAVESGQIQLRRYESFLALAGAGQ
jgi:ribosome biogenesis GTPase